MGEDLGRLDATAQAHLVRSGQVSPRELVTAAIDRIERVDPQLNAVVHRRFDQALREADAPPRGPFTGVPLLVKDLRLHIAGEPMSQGSRVLKTAGPPAEGDDHLTVRLRRAGLIFVGRTATAEFGMGATTETSAFGPTRNPWDPGRSPGGSSGGSAAAVAAGLAPAAHGSDLGGSLRIPAAACGIVTLKPSRGRISPGPFLTDGPGSWWTSGMLARSVRDVAAFLDVMAGYEAGDPATAPPPARPYAREVGADPGRLRIGLAAHAFAPMIPLDPECAAAVGAAGSALEGYGHAVENAHPAALEESDAFSEACAAVLSAGLAADIESLERRLGRPIGDDEIEPPTAQLRALGREIGGPRLVGALNWLELYSRRVQKWWADSPGGYVGGYDLLVTPTVPLPAPPLGWSVDPVESVPRTFALAHFTVFFSVTGQPAMSLPLGRTSTGLPVGVQIVAAYGREDLLLRVAAQLEQALPWGERMPPIHA